jgi:hypothetical protein
LCRDFGSAISADAANADPRLRETSWGMASLRQPAGTRQSGGVDNRARMLYVYGIRNQSPLNRQLLLARVPADAVQEPGQWRFYAGDGKWSGRHQDAVSIAEDLVNELSVEECTIEGRSLLVMVHSEPLFGRHIFLRTASRPEGPWSKRVPVYSVPEVDRKRGHDIDRPSLALATKIIRAVAVIGLDCERPDVRRDCRRTDARPAPREPGTGNEPQSPNPPAAIQSAIPLRRATTWPGESGHCVLRIG